MEGLYIPSEAEKLHRQMTPEQQGLRRVTGNLLSVLLDKADLGDGTQEDAIALVTAVKDNLVTAQKLLNLELQTLPPELELVWGHLAQPVESE